MPILNIKDPEAHELASTISRSTGKSLTRVVIDALRIERQKIAPRDVNVNEVRAILARLRSVPDVDPRPSQAIIDDLYDENGLPH